MAQNEEKYKRLPGRSRASISWFDPNRYQLWLGEDHLLHLSWTHFSESYKRFYLKDIQTIVISRTISGRILNIVLGILLLISTLLCWPLASGAGITIQVMIFGTFAPMFAILLGWNTLFGPTCRCCLHTAVQVEELPSLGRLRSARKAFAILQSAIEAAQGRLTAEDLEASSEKQTMHQASAHALPASAAPSKEAVTLKHENGKAHMFLFAFMLIGSATYCVDLFFRNSLGRATDLKDSFDMAVFLAALLLAVVALIRQRNSDITKNLKMTTWVVLGILIASFVVGISLATAYTIAFPEEATSQTLERPVFRIYMAIDAIIYAAAGLIGLVQLSIFKSSYAASKAAVPKADLYEKDPSDEG